eukprot:TRINITY_DN1847_c0_g1_i1.p1 TRINITY_DN1847_c0_g1~~TRINITY_DN1847_c0_g1_i1.p1  ORF type:complete len:447 (-),score=70.02 TRINITY_DN1847_c0_g1_i1:398-1738(-)
MRDYQLYDNDDYMAEDYEMADVDEELEDEYNYRRVDVDSDSDEDYDMISRPTDTSAAQARRGKDIQGIPWDTLNLRRETYRATRLEQYKNYENVHQSRDELEKICKKPQKGENYYEFCHNTRTVKSTIVHFQLRNLVWSTSKHDAYLLSNYSIIHWSPLTRRGTEVLNVAGHIVPTEIYPGTIKHGLTRVQVSTMAVKDNLLVAGGFLGELICKYLDEPGVSYCSKITYDENAITNAVEIYQSSSGATHFMTSSNDCGVRVFDTEWFSVLRHFTFPWAVNHTSIHPDNKLFVVVGDDCEGFLADSQSGKPVASLRGHLDYSFASAWHPDGRIFATGNQDTTCRLWDVRNTSTSLEVLKGYIGAIRSIRFSSDGKFMAMAEPADFVHIYDTANNYDKCQEIDFFGEIAGFSFSPDTEALFIGVADRTYGSLLEYTRRHEYFYLDSLL